MNTKCSKEIIICKQQNNEVKYLSLSISTLSSHQFHQPHKFLHKILLTRNHRPQRGPFRASLWTNHTQPIHHWSEWPIHPGSPSRSHTINRSLITEWPIHPGPPSRPHTINRSLITEWPIQPGPPSRPHTINRSLIKNWPIQGLPVDHTQSIDHWPQSSPFRVPGRLHSVGTSLFTDWPIQGLPVDPTQSVDHWSQSGPFRASLQITHSQYIIVHRVAHSGPPCRQHTVSRLLITEWPIQWSTKGKIEGNNSVTLTFWKGITVLHLHFERE